MCSPNQSSRESLHIKEPSPFMRQLQTTEIINQSQKQRAFSKSSSLSLINRLINSLTCRNLFKAQHWNYEKLYLKITKKVTENWNWQSLFSFPRKPKSEAGEEELNLKDSIMAWNNTIFWLFLSPKATYYS